MNRPTPAVRPLHLLLGVALAAVLTACSGAAASPSPSPTPPPSAAPSASPSDGLGSGTDPGGGIVDPGAGNGGNGGDIVVPVPGQQNVRAIPAESFEVDIDGRRVLVKVTWTSGVAPCYVLDSVDVQRVDNDFAILLNEGTSDPNQACIEIAQTKSTIVDLGELEPGTYTVSSPGGSAAPVSFTVS